MKTLRGPRGRFTSTVTVEDAMRIVALRRQGEKTEVIALRLGLPIGRVRRVLYKAKLVQPRDPGFNRPRASQ